MSRPGCVERGQGRTAVLLLHGIGGGRSIWGPDGSNTVQAIADAGFRALAMDFPGYGGAPGEPTLDAMVQAVLDLAAHARTTAGVERTVLLGHSMGGMVAQEVALRAPQAVQGLVLACTSAAFGRTDGAWQARFIAERLAPLDAGLGMAGVAGRLVPGMVSPQAPPEALRIARDVMSRVPEASYRVALQAIAGFDRREALAGIAVPTLLLAGEHDRTAPAEVMQRMSTRIAGSEYRCLPAAGHIAPVETPAAFHQAVVSFLQRHFAAPSGD